MYWELKFWNIDSENTHSLQNRAPKNKDFKGQD